MFKTEQPGKLISVVVGGQRVSNFTPEAPSVKNEAETDRYTRVISTVSASDTIRFRSAPASTSWCDCRSW